MSLRLGSSALVVLSLAMIHCAAETGVDGEINLPGRASGGGAGDPNTSAPGDSSTTPGSGSSVDTKPPPPSDPPIPSCDRSKPFGSPVAVAGLPAGVHLATPRLAIDERTIYFTMHVDGIAKLGRATRPSAASPFDAPMVITSLASSAKDNDPAPSADGKMLWFSSERSGQGDELFVAVRNDLTAEFEAPERVPGVGSSSDEQHPWYRMAANELWFSSSRSGTWDIYMAQRPANGVFGTPKRVDELRSDASSRQPMVTEDGLTLLFASERSGGRGKRDLWIARRANATTKFEAPKPIAEINSSADEFGGWLSPDGCRVYFSSDREVEKRHRIYMATRPN